MDFYTSLFYFYLFFFFLSFFLLVLVFFFFSIHKKRKKHYTGKTYTLLMHGKYSHMVQILLKSYAYERERKNGVMCGGVWCTETTQRLQQFHVAPAM